MSVRSIDLQVAIPRAADASKNQQIQQQYPQNQQQQVMEQLLHSQELKQQRTATMEKTEQNKIRRDQKQDKQGGSGKRRESTHDEPDQDQAVKDHEDPVRGNLIDIKT